jgi:hypothetical protein
MTVTQILLSPSSAKQPTFSQKTSASLLLHVRKFVASDRPFLPSGSSHFQEELYREQKP